MAVQRNHRQMLIKQLSSVKFLIRQGLTIRGHDDAESNFVQLLQLNHHAMDNQVPYAPITVSINSISSFFLHGIIFGSLISFLVDTGAGVSLISWNVWDKSMSNTLSTTSHSWG